MRSLGAKGRTQLTVSKKTKSQSFHSKELYLADNLKGLGIVFFPEPPSCSLGWLTSWL